MRNCASHTPHSPTYYQVAVMRTQATAVAGSEDKMIKMWDLGSEGLMHNCAPHNLQPASPLIAGRCGQWRWMQAQPL